MNLSFYNLCATYSAGSSASVPLGALYCVASLENSGFEVEFFDYQLFDIPFPMQPKSVMTFLESATSRIIMISCWENLLPSILLATRQLKMERPELTIIIGGMGATGKSKGIMQLFPHIDFIVRGPGEDVLPKIIHSLVNNLQFQGGPGVCYRTARGEIVCPDTIALLPPVDEIPWPAYDRVDLTQYGRVLISSSRGCPYRCDFCSVPGQWGGACHFRSVSRFLEEVEFLHKKMGIQRIHITDDTFLASPKRALAFCQGVRKSCPGLKWTCYSRIDLMDEAICETMSAAGCDSVYYGVESGSNRILKRMDKKFDTDRAIDVIRMSHGYFKVVASFLWGLPYEDMRDFSETIILMSFLAEEMRDNIDLQLYFVAPLALSQLQRDYSDRIRFSPEFWSYFTWGDDFIFSGPEVEQLVKSHLELFPGLGYFESPDLQAKITLARKLGLVQ